jgi:glutaredoxin
MPEVLLFTKPGCEKCEYVKERIPPKVEVKFFDIESADGMAEGAFYEVLHKHTPILVVDGEHVEGALNIVKRLNVLAGEGI